ncbi:hypothetical protein LINPERHAP1_LOCUS21741, partial [Linum perenne]
HRTNTSIHGTHNIITSHPSTKSLPQPQAHKHSYSYYLGELLG